MEQLQSGKKITAIVEVCKIQLQKETDNIALCLEPKLINYGSFFKKLVKNAFDNILKLIGTFKFVTNQFANFL